MPLALGREGLQEKRPWLSWTETKSKLVLPGEGQDQAGNAAQAQNWGRFSQAASAPVPPGGWPHLEAGSNKPRKAAVQAQPLLGWRSPGKARLDLRANRRMTSHYLCGMLLCLQLWETEGKMGCRGGSEVLDIVSWSSWAKWMGTIIWFQNTSWGCCVKIMKIRQELITKLVPGEHGVISGLWILPWWVIPFWAENEVNPKVKREQIF